MFGVQPASGQYCDLAWLDPEFALESRTPRCLRNDLYGQRRERNRLRIEAKATRMR